MNSGRWEALQAVKEANEKFGLKSGDNVKRIPPKKGFFSRK